MVIGLKDPSSSLILEAPVYHGLECGAECLSLGSRLAPSATGFFDQSVFGEFLKGVGQDVGWGFLQAKP